MKKIIPFKKEMLFNSNVFEITSISLEQDLKIEGENLVSGNFYISGEYKMSDSSTNTETFNFDIPCDISLNEKYIVDNITIDIDDFYYEIINSNILQVSIDVSIDHLEEKEESIQEIEIKRTSLSELELDLERKEDVIMDKEIDQTDLSRCIEPEEMEETKSIFNNFNDSMETYKTYKIYIVREGDSLESIIQKYNIDKESLEQYNNLSEINLGDKLIIPDLEYEKN